MDSTSVGSGVLLSAFCSGFLGVSGLTDTGSGSGSAVPYLSMMFCRIMDAADGTTSVSSLPFLDGSFGRLMNSQASSHAESGRNGILM